MTYCKDVANLLFWEVWECLNIPIKTIVLICTQLSCLSGCKNSSSLLNCFLRCCKEIASLLFWVIWAWTQHTHTHTHTHTTPHHTTPHHTTPHHTHLKINLRRPLTFNYMKKINFILHVFLEILQRNCELLILSTLSMPGYTHPSDSINL